jgi:DNA-binding GntR family transcriptional regulator
MHIDSVTNSALKSLRAKIITGELHQGQRLNEVELSSHLGISRPPLREAFRILEQRNLIVNIPRRGSFVAKLSIEDFEEIYTARQMIECRAVDLISEKGKRSFPELESIIEATTDLTPPLDHNQMKQLDYLEELTAFHRKLVEACGNKLMLHFYETIIWNLARYQYIYFFAHEKIGNAQEDHRLILEFMEKGRYSEARKTLEGHVGNYAALMRSLMLKAKRTQVAQAL